MPATLGPYNGLTWNWDDYDAATNPRGLGKGGFREETGLKGLLDAVLADVGVSLQMAATDDVEIGTGDKTFTPTVMRGVSVGMWCYAIYDADNYLFGQVTVKTSTQVTLTVPAGRAIGAGSYAVWTLQPTGPGGLETAIGKSIAAAAASA